MFVYTKVAGDTDSLLCLVCPFVKPVSIVSWLSAECKQEITCSCGVE